jgi:hypothetical protein
MPSCATFRLQPPPRPTPAHENPRKVPTPWATSGSSVSKRSRFARSAANSAVQSAQLNICSSRPCAAIPVNAASSKGSFHFSRSFLISSLPVKAFVRREASISPSQPESRAPRPHQPASMSSTIESCRALRSFSGSPSISFRSRSTSTRSSAFLQGVHRLTRSHARATLSRESVAVAHRVGDSAPDERRCDSPRP